MMRNKSPFLRWTRLKISEELPVRQRDRISFGTSAGVNNPYWSESQTNFLHRKLREDSYFGAGIIEQKDLSRVDWAAVENGVIFAFPQINLTQQQSSDAPVPEDRIGVHVFPLGHIAAVAVSAIAVPSWLATYSDARAFYLYGARRIYFDENEQWEQAATYCKKCVNCDAEPMLPRFMLAVRDGKILTAADNCLKCRHKSEWLHSKCRLLSYSCVYGKQSFEMFSQHGTWNPNLDAMFGKDAYRNNTQCIVREPFKPVVADRIVVDNDDDVYKKFMADAKHRAVAAGEFRRVENKLCPICICYEGKRKDRLREGCGCRVDTCDGPFLRSDFPTGSDAITVEPWKYHVMACRDESFSVDKIRPLVSGLEKRRADMKVLTFVGEKLPPHLRRCSVSAAAKRSKRRVELRQNLARTSSGIGVIISYGEFCALVKQSRCDSWQSFKRVWARREITDLIHLTFAHLCRGAEGEMRGVYNRDFHFGPTDIGWTEDGDFRRYQATRSIHYYSADRRYEVLQSRIATESFLRNRCAKQLLQDEASYMRLRHASAATVLKEAAAEASAIVAARDAET